MVLQKGRGAGLLNGLIHMPRPLLFKIVSNPILGFVEWSMVWPAFDCYQTDVAGQQSPLPAGSVWAAARLALACGSKQGWKVTRYCQLLFDAVSKKN